MARVEAPGFRSERGAEYYQDAAFGAIRLAPEYIEFLTWKHGKDRAFADLSSGVRAQTLRYLDLLTFEPLAFDLRRIEALALRAPTEVLIPQPAMFIAQKALSRPERAPAKQPKDLAYIHDVAVTTHSELATAREVLRRAARRRHDWSRWIAHGLRDLEKLFATPVSIGPHEVRSVYRDVMPPASIPGPAAISTVILEWLAGVRSRAD